MGKISPYSRRGKTTEKAQVCRAKADFNLWIHKKLYNWKKQSLIYLKIYTAAEKSEQNP
ncbi:hypothetical protein COLO4_31147 [Corchorus olitorius]|uniref:Uncharacterized protein n=1 Tax=Corchorus olitorius TaxID=93759 RepID=A0A1R3H5B0_9ROSI|nr:hypothetical protein COLO4_31147 [Corchorus olitorius]